VSFLRRGRPARAARPADRARPRLEALEGRCVPSTDIVTNLSGSAAVAGSLPYEVAQAAPGDTIVFAANLKGGTITLGQTLDINKNLIVDGAGGGITVNGGGHRVFQIEFNVEAAINALTITGGAAPGAGDGGGILNDGDLLLSNSTLTGNAAVQGGGIFNEGVGLTMLGDTVNNNKAVDSGGGVYNDTFVAMVNCTIAANHATSGGGIANTHLLEVANSTVAFNTVAGAGADGGGIFTFGGSDQLDLLNTIVYDPNSGAATSNEVLGTVAQAQGDLFGSAPVKVAPGGDHGGNAINYNPLLGPLQNNGGPTATMALLPGSPAIGIGAATSAIPAMLDVPKADQRGVPRPANSIDMGAFQAQLPPPSVSVAFGPAGEVLEVVSSAGVLTQYDASGAHVLGGGVRFASVAFGPAGEELLVTFLDGRLVQFDAGGALTLGGGVQSASVAFGPAGEVLEVVSSAGVLTQYDAAGAHAVGGGVSSASVAFAPGGQEVLEVVNTAGVLTQFDAAGAHVLGGGVRSAAVAFAPDGQEVCDVITLADLLFQYDSAGTHPMGQIP
jgi:hypothetical protein